MGEETDRGHGPEDPFEGLDRFFAPIDAVRWPDGVPSGGDGEQRGQHGVERGAPASSRDASGAAPSARPAAPSTSASRRASIDELLDLTANDATAAVAGAAPEPSSPMILSEAGQPIDVEPTPSEDWRRLKDVLGDDSDQTVIDEPPALIDLDDDAFDLERGYATVSPGAASASIGAAAMHRASAGPDEPPPADRPGNQDAADGVAAGSEPPPVRERVIGRPQGDPGPGPPAVGPEDDSPSSTTGPAEAPAAPPSSPYAGDDELSAAWPEPEIEEERGGLTLEDLKKAPPEYRGLPGPRSPEPADAPPYADTPAGSGVGSGVMAASSQGPPEQGGAGGDAPSLAEVEAMAENLAREFRAGPPQDEVMEEIQVETRPEAPVSRPTPEREPVRFDDDLIGEFEPPEPPQPPPARTPRTVKVGAPEDLTGPAWEDPTARTVTREKVPPAPRERDLPMAVITAAVLIAAALLSIALSTLAFAIVATVVIVISQAEFYAAAHHQGYHPATLLGLVAGAMVAGGAYFHGEAGLLAMSMLALVATFLWFMATPPKARTDVVANAGVTLFGMLYIAVAGSFYLIILKSTDRAPRALVLAILGLTFLYDVAAFFIGRYWGRHPLAPTISPRKSVQGLIGATFVTLLVASILPRSFGPFDTELKLFALGLTIVIFAPLGDLAESLLKRDLGIKDMGSILPGHGGMLDRVDSAIFVGPAVFYLMRLIS